MKKLKTINDIKYSAFKKAEPYLKNVDNITTEEIVKVVSFIYEEEESVVKEMNYTLILEYFNLFLVTMGTNETDLVTKFESEGVKYGFIPNFSEITTGELIDLDSLLVDKNFEGIASILYRPITKENKDGRYEIEPYKGYDAELFKNASVRFYLGFIDFFFKSYQILKNNSLTSLNKK